MKYIVKVIEPCTCQSCGQGRGFTLYEAVVDPEDNKRSHFSSSNGPLGALAGLLRGRGELEGCDIVDVVAELRDALESAEQLLKDSGLK